jgi:hypothetical protein
VSLEPYLDVETAHELLPHVDALRELGIPHVDAMILAAQEVTLRDAQHLLDQGCAPELVAEILA